MSGFDAVHPSATYRAQSSQRVAPAVTTQPQRWPMVAAFVGLGILAFGLRCIFLTQQSAFMDENSNILIGRYLIEHGSSYAFALDWSYGSYLWALITGAADIVGGLTAVRLVTAALGVLMVWATATAALRLAPPHIAPNRRWLIALVGGLIMALAPTAIGLGHYASYDSLAAAAFMWGVVLLIPDKSGKRGRGAMLSAATLFFVAFLAKYLVAIYFPFVCLFLFFALHSLRGAIRSALWFSLPLAAACAAYFLIFRDSLINLLHYSSVYNDLRSPQPLNEYVLTRPEVWLLLVLALLGLWRATRTGLITAIGVITPILLFQAWSRPDYDFWKHSIYVIFGLAPLAVLAVCPVVNVLLERGKVRRRVLVAVATLALVALASILSLPRAVEATSFYPNLNGSLAAIRQQTATAQRVLVDDSAIRYYLYPRLTDSNVIDPFYINYNGQIGLDGYRHAILDRHFDTLILDGGVGPVASQLRVVLSDEIHRAYQLVYTGDTGNGGYIEIYHPRSATLPPMTSAAPSMNQMRYIFRDSALGWGGQPEQGELKAGSYVTVTSDQKWQGNNSLKFTPTADVSVVGIRNQSTVKRLRAHIYVVGVQGVTQQLGIFGFDKDWHWHDDGFTQSIPAGQWVEVTWQLDQPLFLNEVGFKFADGAAQTLYIGDVTLES